MVWTVIGLILKGEVTAEIRSEIFNKIFKKNYAQVTFTRLLPITSPIRR